MTPPPPPCCAAVSWKAYLYHIYMHDPSPSSLQSWSQQSGEALGSIEVQPQPSQESIHATTRQDVLGTRGGGRGQSRGRGTGRGSYTPTGGQAAWLEVRIPDEMPIYFDVVNIHMGYAATRENHLILERCMQRLYPKWEHGIRKPLRSTCDSSRRVRAIGDINVKESLQLLLKWDDFGRHIWEQVRPVSMEYGLVINDVVKFCKTFCLILCCGVSIDRYYKNRRKVRAFPYLYKQRCISLFLPSI